MRRSSQGSSGRTTWAALTVGLALAWGTMGAGAQEPVSPAPWDELRGQVRLATATLAGELDAFLSDREYEAGLNETRLALRAGVDATRDGDLRAILEPRIRLRLPNTERMLFVDVFGFDTAGPDASATAGGLLPGNLGGSIDAIQLRLGTTFRGLDLAPALGLRFDEARPSAYAGLRVGASRQLSSGLALSGSQRLVLDSQRWLQAITLLRADWQTDARSLVRAQFVLDWRRDEEGLRREPSLIWRRLVDDRTAISFENTASIYTAASANEDSFESALRIRRQTGIGGVFAEVRPWLTVDPVDGDERTWGVELSLDVTF
jgi:hypothetical protein